MMLKLAGDIISFTYFVISLIRLFDGDKAGCESALIIGLCLGIFTRVRGIK